jgi:hypothetical protein
MASTVPGTVLNAAQYCAMPAIAIPVRAAICSFTTGCLGMERYGPDVCP